VPGFMAGVEAMHSRFGRLPFGSPVRSRDLVCRERRPHLPRPPVLFMARGKFLSRTPEGQAFMRQAGDETPKAGGLFVQPELAKTLKAICQQGSRYMYTGPWAEDFVRIVRREEVK